VIVGSAITALVVLAAIVLRRPHGWGPPAGAAAAVAVALVGGAVVPDDFRLALDTLWRPFLTLMAIMTMTAAAERLGLLDRIAAMIEPRTRGPVRHAFRVTFGLAAVVAAVLSNDAAILLLTPVVLTLIRTVYPRRYPVLLLPFSFAVFAAAGVAPLVVSNPMNLVVAERAGIGFNQYALTMIPVAVVGWVVAYAVLAWRFRGVLVDEVAAPGDWPAAIGPLGAGGRVVVIVLGAVLLAYPVVSYLDGPLWIVAAGGAAVCVAVALRAGVAPGALAAGVSWSVFPFLLGAFVLAVGLERAGAVDHLVWLFTDDTAPLATIGVTAALGSAVLNNHPMAILDVLALEQVPGAGEPHVLAALIGGDLGPRLSPMGSLAGLLWFDILRRHGVAISVVAFIRIGVVVTVPTLAASLGMLWLLT
jgi:arsenical pump membrane protein